MRHLIFLDIWPLFLIFAYPVLLAGAFYLIYKWVTKIISLKQEHNDLLREILKKMDTK
jgi:hypothetical protein